MAKMKRPPKKDTGAALRPVFHFAKPGTRLVRIFSSIPHSTGPLTFRSFGPLLRFDHQRGKSGAPIDDPERGIYYAAEKLSGCIVEVFGDTKIIENDAYHEWHVAFVTTTRRLRLLDLRGEGAMAVGTVTAVCGDSRRDFSQQWSRHFYENAAFENCDGLIYHNAHNNEIAYALYERAAPALASAPNDVYSLGDARLRDSLLQIAERHVMDLKI